MAKLFYPKSIIKQGIFMGLSFCCYTIFMWLTNLDTIYLSYGRYLDMAIILLPIVMIFWAINQEIKKDKITIIQRISIAILVSLISFIIYNPFLYLYHHYINPEWFNAVLNLKELELKSLNIPINEVKLELSKMKVSSIAKAELFQLSSIISSVIIIPTLIAFLSILFIKNKK